MIGLKSVRGRSRKVCFFWFSGVLREPALAGDSGVFSLQSGEQVSEKLAERILSKKKKSILIRYPWKVFQSTGAQQ